MPMQSLMPGGGGGGGAPGAGGGGGGGGHPWMTGVIVAPLRSYNLWFGNS